MAEEEIMSSGNPMNTKCPVCMQDAKLTCSACKKVSYCCVEHQHKHWKNHKNICKLYEIKHSPTLGNYLLAVYEINTETIIFKDLPIIVGPKVHDTYPKSVCLTCYRPISKDSKFRCPKCCWPLCSPDCPGNLKIHEDECEMYQTVGFCEESLTANISIYQTVLPLRCLLMQKSNPKKWKKIKKMESHVSQRGPDTEVFRDIQARIVDCLKNYLNKYEKKLQEKNKCLGIDYSDAMIHRICGIIDVNCHEIQLPFGTDILALYPTAYLLEHSCVPNTSHTFDTTEGSKQFRMTLRATRSIEKGEHISTSYTNILWSNMARREHLRSAKYFTCKCERCEDPTELGTYLGAIQCRGAQLVSQYDSPSQCLRYYESTRTMPLPSCVGTLLPVTSSDDSIWQCNKCETTIQSHEAFELCSCLGEEIDIALKMTLSISIYEALLTKLTTFLHPNHYHCFIVKHSLMQMYGREAGYLHPDLSEEMLKRKINTCREMISIIQVIDPTHARLSLYTVVLLIELHFALIHLASKEVKKSQPSLSPMEACLKGLEAKSLLQRAQDMLSMEPENSAGHKLLEPINKFMKDLDVWMKQVKPTL